MRYILLIHQGDTPVPGTEAWDALSGEEQARSTRPTRRSTRRPG